MTIDQLEEECRQSEEASARSGSALPPAIVLVIPGGARGNRRKVFPGVMGGVLGEKGEKGNLQTVVHVLCKDVRRAVAAHRHAEQRRAVRP